MLHIPIVHADNVCKQMPREKLKLPRLAERVLKLGGGGGGVKRMKKREETRGSGDMPPPEKF